MKIIGLNGSPREESNVRFLLSKALDKAKGMEAETELIEVRKIMDKQEDPFCIHCSSPCDKRCYEGTELDTVYDKLMDADGIILASPVYFGSVSAQLKALWDKSRAVRTEYGLVGTVGAAISVGASAYGGQETTMTTLHNMMLVHGMTIVANGIKGIKAGHYGAAGKDQVFQNEHAIEDAEIVGKRVVETIK